MFRSKIIPIEKIGELIADNAVVTVSSSSGLGCPDAALRSIGKYFLEKGKPRGITAIHPIAAQALRVADHIKGQIPGTQYANADQNPLPITQSQFSG